MNQEQRYHLYRTITQDLEFALKSVKKGAPISPLQEEALKMFNAAAELQEAVRQRDHQQYLEDIEAEKKRMGW